VDRAVLLERDIAGGLGHLKAPVFRLQHDLVWLIVGRAWQPVIFCSKEPSVVLGHRIFLSFLGERLVDEALG